MLSKLPLTVEIPFDALAALVNTYVADYLHTHHNWLESREVRQIRIRLRSEVRMMAREGHLITDVPLEIQADVLPSLFKGLVGLPLFDKLQRIKFAISLRFQTQVSMEKDGQLQTHTEVRFSWDRKPTAATGLVSLSAFFSPLIDQELETLTETIDQELSQVANLPQLMQGAWQQLGQWERVETEPPVWFLFALEKIRVDRNLQIRSHAIHLPMLLEGKLALCLSPDQPIAPVPGPFQLELAEGLPAGNEQRLEFLLPLPGINSYLQKTHFDLSREGMPFFMEALSVESRESAWMIKGALHGKWRGIPFHGEGHILAELKRSAYPVELNIKEIKIRQGNLPFRLGLRFLGKKRLLALLNRETNLMLEDIREQIEQSWTLVELPDSLWLKGEKRGGRVLGIGDEGKGYRGLRDKGLVVSFGFEAVAKVILRR